MSIVELDEWIELMRLSTSLFATLVEGVPDPGLIRISKKQLSLKTIQLVLDNACLPYYAVEAKHYFSIKYSKEREEAFKVAKSY